jgi:hypothetical protein
MQTKLSMAETELDELRNTLKVRMSCLRSVSIASSLMIVQEKNAELAKLRGGR